DFHVTGVQTCALPILYSEASWIDPSAAECRGRSAKCSPIVLARLEGLHVLHHELDLCVADLGRCPTGHVLSVAVVGPLVAAANEIGRASCRERGERSA